MTAPRITLRDATCHERRARLRLPFRFGNALIEELPVLYLRTTWETEDGRRLAGFAASVVSGAWFDKRADRTLHEREAALHTTVGQALAIHADLGPAAAWTRHEQASEVLLEAGRGAGIPDLVSSFGLAIVDAAAIDAVCRAAECSFHDVLLSGLLGGAPAFPATLPPAPLESLAIRHTVGLADPLTSSDRGDLPDDGVPRTLEEIIATTGVHAFKVKIGSELEPTRDRLRAIEAVLASRAPEAFVTLDANEAFGDPDRFARFAEALQRDLSLDRFRARVRWIEQPLARDVAFQDEAALAMHRAACLAPVILDESDGSDDVAERLLAHGYQGVSAKNGKGVFRTLHSHSVLQHASRTLGTETILSGEDLTLPAVVPWHQDAVVAASLGIEHVERNAHHYLRGLDHLSPAEREHALAVYPGLYERVSDDFARLRIVAGRVDLRDLLHQPFGVAQEPDWSALEEIDPCARRARS
ncbi:MAG: hypothetical protein H6834_10835 [Planctomycetes bacterium]|nr:hypothetical protein [Planctomycetota bacterium]